MEHDVQMQIKLIDHRKRSMFFMGMGLLSIVIGLILTPSLRDILTGLRIQYAASQLAGFNTFAAVGDGRIGAPFVNAGLMLIIVMLTYRLTKTKISGRSIAAALVVFGFSFEGKTLWNVWPLFLGVMLYAVIHQKKLRSVTSLGWFAAALSPLVSMFTLYVRWGSAASSGDGAVFSPLGLFFAIVIGLLAGYLVAALSGLLPGIHKGLTLYNVAFATGLIGFFVFAVLKTLGYAHEPISASFDLSDDVTLRLFLAAIVLLLFCLLGGFIIMKKEGGTVRDLLLDVYTGSAVERFGFGGTLVSMSLCGFLCLLYLKLTVTGNLNGVFFACLFTVVGFAANGISLRAMLPIMAGVYGTSFLLAGAKALIIGAPFLETAFAYVGSDTMLIAAVFACGMAPVVYEYGALFGLLAGAMHAILVPNTGGLHGWMNLYNNGFCIGLVVTFFVPLLLKLCRRDPT